jgi:hypothetical protein
MSTVEVWLVAIAADVPPHEVRQHWNSKEAPTLDRLIVASPSLRLGTTNVRTPDNEDLRGPVGRVIDLIFPRGTSPAYTLPLVDDELEAELLLRIQDRPEDPAFEVVSADELEAFLNQNRGAGLTYRDGGAQG